MSLKLYFLRHGQTNHSRDNMFCGAGSDPDITIEGRAMAAQFAASYQATYFDSIYCSTQSRAKQTLAPLVKNSNYEAQYRSQLREIEYGLWEGQTLDLIKSNFSKDYAAWELDPSVNPPNSGETAKDIERRFNEVLEEIKQKHTDGRILIISHKATIRIAISSLLGLPLKEYRNKFACPVASLSIVEFKKTGPCLNCLADRSHLSKELQELPGT